MNVSCSRTTTQWRRWGSNLRPFGLESSTLPLSHCAPKVLRNSWNLQNVLESLPEKCMCNLKQFGKVTIFYRKMPTAPDLRERMNFWHFLKGLQNSWNLQNLLESLPETCIWNLKQLGEVSIFDRKMLTAPDLRKRMIFWHFSNVSNIHETYRIY